MDRETFITEFQEIPPAHQRRSWWVWLFFLAVIAVVVACLALYTMTRAPRDFPLQNIYVLESGSTLRDVSTQLTEQRIIKNQKLFEVIVLVSGNKDVIAGDYLFAERDSMLHIARRVTTGDYGDSRIRISLPEGATVEQMADILDENFEGFDRELFMKLALGMEGYLFPDTYFFFPSTDTRQIFDTLESAFETQIADLLPDITASDHDLEDIVTMASIIEREAANNDEERKIISGILWKRIAINMPLQVDAPFVYILGKGSAQLTRSDLAEDSPYNTYTNLGLPPGPIGNPSRAALEAALYPTDTDYLFYLHGSDGLVRYARNHDEHVINKNSYLP